MLRENSLTGYIQGKNRMDTQNELFYRVVCSILIIRISISTAYSQNSVSAMMSCKV